MVEGTLAASLLCRSLSVLALSSRFDGLYHLDNIFFIPSSFQYSLCRVVLMVSLKRRDDETENQLSVLALSSRFDGHLF